MSGTRSKCSGIIQPCLSYCWTVPQCPKPEEPVARISYWVLEAAENRGALAWREGRTPTWTRLSLWTWFFSSMLFLHCRYFSWWVWISSGRVEVWRWMFPSLGVGWRDGANSFASVSSSWEMGIPNSWLRSLTMEEEGSRSLIITSLSLVLLWQMSWILKWRTASHSVSPA